MADSVFHPEFKAMPYWWEAWRPTAEGAEASLPARADVAIVGAGYAGLSAAIELAANGVAAVVIEANEPGFGASTRNGGAVSGGVNIGKSFSGKSIDPDSERAAQLLSDAAEAFSCIEHIIEREKIQCFWEKRGRFVGAWAPKHYKAMARKVEILNRAAHSGCGMVPRERQREEIASDYYHGGMVVERTAKLHPALYYKGLLDAARGRKITICSKAPVVKIARIGGAWRLETARGTVEANEVVIATNGYTGDATPRLKRRVIPIASHIIATEELSSEVAASLIPKGRTLSDTRRVLCYYRMSPDGKRVIFGGRARFTPVTPQTSAPILHRFMLDRFPQLKGVRVTHAWTGNVAFTLDALPHMGRDDGMHYALGCNGSGVAMMTYLGHQTARKIVGKANSVCAFDSPEFPDHPLYRGNPWFLPLVGCWYRLRDEVDRLFT
ncbi:NAD(P)/FAD-dependent oxidoreductase [Bradyrhizobium sp.]|uniref:NAD(P)/FAD-dependent oxidoreductase n=1 Tax=Bradyrhizobium sp. TaxID=376 RepID=UPI0025C648D7|nr:FAD-binding oxidoreductase [Bradyrhizobium sp.]